AAGSEPGVTIERLERPRPGRTARGLVGRVATVLALVTAGVTVGLDASPALQVSVVPKAPHPGDVVLVHIQGAPSGARLVGGGHRAGFLPGRGGVAGPGGLDRAPPPAPAAGRVLPPPGAAGARPGAAGTVPVHPKTSPARRLPLPPHQVD